MTILCRFDFHFDESGKPMFPPIPGHAESAGRETSRKKLKVIVVDDEPVIANSLADILNGEGCETVALSSGAAAVELARQIQPDVVISDVAMPDMNGIETVQRIRAFLPDCRIVLFSGHASTADLLMQARAEGNVFELLTKPVRPAALLSLLGLLPPKQ
jgi:CheY-like chemotaxis protein